MNSETDPEYELISDQMKSTFPIKIISDQKSTVFYKFWVSLAVSHNHV